MTHDPAEQEPEYRRQLRHDLHAAGIEVDSIWELVNARFDPPEAVPIMVDWLTHLDERVPDGEPRKAVRLGLMRNLATKHARGNRAAFDQLAKQYTITPRLSSNELFVVGNALHSVAERSDYQRMAELIAASPDGIGTEMPVRWLGRFKTPEAKQLAVEQLRHPAARAHALRTLRNQGATETADVVAEFLDDPSDEVRKQARLTLEKFRNAP